MSRFTKNVSRRLKKGLERSRSELHELGEQANRGLRRAMGKRSCIAVTGFSGAGKSTLLTSLINQLLNVDVQQAQQWWPEIKHRWLSAQLIQTTSDIPDYPFRNHVELLRQGQWPPSTQSITRCLLEIRLKPRSRLEDLAGKGYVSHELEIWDYPGEWLMDLPLATMNYAQWVGDSYAHFNNEPRNQLAPALYRTLLDLDPMAAFEGEKFDRIFKDYQQFLMECKQLGLHIINPGRFALESADLSLLPAFIPLLSAYGRDMSGASEGSWWWEMSRRYQHYVGEFVSPFLQQVFEQVDHQLVLVDLLGALGQGKSSLEELRRSLIRVLQLFSYGRNGWLDKLMAPKIERLTFVASKLDCVLPNQRAHLAELMRALVVESIQAARFHSTTVEHLELAAVACTQIGVRAGEQALVVEQHGQQAWLSHPHLPRGWPTDNDWHCLTNWRPPLLAPPPLPDPALLPWPNLQMAQLCQHLFREFRW